MAGVYQPPPFHLNRPMLVAPVCVDPTGMHGPTRSQVRGPRWRTTSHGRHVPVTAPAEDPGQRAVEAAALLRPGEAVTGWAALHWLGGYWFTGSRADGSPLPVPIVTGREVVAPPWVRVSQEHLRGGERILVDGLPVTDAVRSVSFEARYAPDLWRAVAAIDMACYSDLVTITDMAACAATIGPWTGIGNLRAAVRHADENAWSPQEVGMRLVWEREGEKPRPLCNVPVFDRWGRHVGTPDLLDPVAGVLGQYDSDLHLVGAQRTKDVRQEGEYRALGLECVTMLASDHADDHRSFLARLHTAYAHARYAAEGNRPWTIVPPRWWIDTTTVVARRNLTREQRERLLRYRRAA